MQCSPHRRTGHVTALALLVMASLGVPHTAFSKAAPSQPTAIDRLVWQEDARKAELARFAEIATRSGAAMRLVIRERAMLERPATATAARPSSPDARHEFAWGAAALGLGAGVAVTCVVLGGITVLRGPGRLRGV